MSDCHNSGNKKKKVVERNANFDFVWYLKKLQQAKLVELLSMDGDISHYCKGQITVFGAANHEDAKMNG